MFRPQKSAIILRTATLNCPPNSSLFQCRHNSQSQNKRRKRFFLTELIRSSKMMDIRAKIERSGFQFFKNPQMSYDPYDSPDTLVMYTSFLADTSFGISTCWRIIKSGTYSNETFINALSYKSFKKGAVQAYLMVSQNLQQQNYDALQDLIEPELFARIKRRGTKLSKERRDLLRFSQNDMICSNKLYSTFVRTDQGLQVARMMFFATNCLNMNLKEKASEKSLRRYMSPELQKSPLNLHEIPVTTVFGNLLLAKNVFGKRSADEDEEWKVIGLNYSAIRDRDFFNIHRDGTVWSIHDGEQYSNKWKS